jgi:hypothetical protein
LLLKSTTDPTTATAHAHQHTHTLTHATMALQPLYTYIWLYVPNSTAPTTSFWCHTKTLQYKNAFAITPCF